MRTGRRLYTLLGAGTTLALVAVASWYVLGHARPRTTRSSEAPAPAAARPSPDLATLANQTPPASDGDPLAPGTNDVRAPQDVVRALAATPDQIASSEHLLLLANVAANQPGGDDLLPLVDDANFVLLKGGSTAERQTVRELVNAGDFEGAAQALYALADRPGGASANEDELQAALRQRGLTDELARFRAEMGRRSLATLERMERSGLGLAAPGLFDITFWRANQYLERDTPEWLRARASLARVGASIPPESRIARAGYVRSLGQWAAESLRRSPLATDTEPSPGAPARDSTP